MKIFGKLPKFPALRRKRKTMRASVARRSLRAATADYEEMAEPNMKLSRALLIVLLLHVVAVSGIIAFNAIKTRQGPSLPRIKSPAASQSAKAESSMVSAAVDETESAKPGEVRKARPVGKENAKDRGKASDASRHDESHKTYVIAKGDTPVSIAKKFKVSYDELLALNHIDDPRKLKIGQKLLIPSKSVKGKKSDE